MGIFIAYMSTLRGRTKELMPFSMLSRAGNSQEEEVEEVAVVVIAQTLVAAVKIMHLWYWLSLGLQVVSQASSTKL